MHLEKLQHDKQMRQLRADAFDREVGEGAFREWRNRYLRHLAAYIRLYHQAQAAIKAGHASASTLAKINWQPHGWCEAAYHIVAHGDPDLCFEFMNASNDEKDAMVGAVMADKGLTDFTGHFSEIPPC